MSEDLAHLACALLYTKPARAGKVKTRLIGALSADQAAELHAAFLGDVRESLARGRFEVELAWALDAGEESWEDAGEETGDDGVSGFRQQGDDLGERLLHGLRRAARRFALVAAVGSDHPELSHETVEDGFRRLDAGADAVLGPTADGGYYLIGLRREAVVPALFEGVPWSTGEVFTATLERCRRAGLEVALLPAGHDVDVAADLKGLAQRLAAGGNGACPRTRALLQTWGWLER